MEWIFIFSLYWSEVDGRRLVFSCSESFIYVLPLLPNHTCSILSFPFFCLFIFYSVSILLTSAVILLVLKLPVLMSQFIVCCSVKETKTKNRDATNYKLLTSHFPQCSVILTSHCFEFVAFYVNKVILIYMISD